MSGGYFAILAPIDPTAPQARTYRWKRLCTAHSLAQARQERDRLQLYHADTLTVVKVHYAVTKQPYLSESDVQMTMEEK